MIGFEPCVDGFDHLIYYPFEKHEIRDCKIIYICFIERNTRVSIYYPNNVMQLDLSGVDYLMCQITPYGGVFSLSFIL